MSWTPDLCIYHGNCDDGFGAAWAIWRRWPDCEFVPGHYGKPLPDATGKNVLFVDFSAKRAEIGAMAFAAKSIVVLDHHKTAQAELEPFTVAVGDALSFEQIPHMLRDLAEMNRPAIIAWFDMEQSGAAMAWQFASGESRAEKDLPVMIQFIEDRDLWRFALGDDTRCFSAALRTYPMSFKEWTGIANDPNRLLYEGETVLRAHRANIAKMLGEAYVQDIGGHKVPVVNAPYHYASDVAHELLGRFPDAPFAGCWFRRADGMIQFSLRSNDDRMDVSEVAKQFGGGGHRNAAGFQLVDRSA